VPIIASGSITIVTKMTSFNAPNTPAALASQQSLNNFVVAGGTIANMGVASAHLTTNGGSNDNNNGGGSSGLPTSTIIILATVIPIGTLLIVGAIVIIYCVHKRKKEQEAGMNEWNGSSNPGDTTGRNIELTIG
jgi:hypothetical protein